MEWGRNWGLHNQHYWCEHRWWGEADSRFHWEGNPLVILNVWARQALLALCIGDKVQPMVINLSIHAACMMQACNATHGPQKVMRLMNWQSTRYVLRPLYIKNSGI